MTTYICTAGPRTVLILVPSKNLNSAEFFLKSIQGNRETSFQCTVPPFKICIEFLDQVLVFQDWFRTNISNGKLSFFFAYTNSFTFLTYVSTFKIVWHIVLMFCALVQYDSANMCATTKYRLHFK